MDSSTAAGNPLVGMLFGLGMLAVAIFIIASQWKVFTKAGRPGWACIIPVYNLYVMLGIAGKPGWWLILFFIPLVNFVALLLLMLGIAAKFGKGVGFGLGLLFLGFIFFPILGFGDAVYQGGTPASS